MAVLNDVLAAVAALAGRCGDEEGQGMAEYALILLLVAIACAAAFTLFAGGLSNEVNSITAAF